MPRLYQAITPALRAAPGRGEALRLADARPGEAASHPANDPDLKARLDIGVEFLAAVADALRRQDEGQKTAASSVN